MHLENVAGVLQMLRDAGLKLKPSKWKFFQRRVKFLGHVFTPDGIGPGEDMVASVVNWPI